MGIKMDFNMLPIPLTTTSGRLIQPNPNLALQCFQKHPESSAPVKG